MANRKNMNRHLSVNQITPGTQVKGGTGNGGSQPPRNRIVAIAHMVLMAMYSPRKNSRNGVVEYSATPFLLFFLGEYIAINTMCAMATILFLGGWLPPFPVPPFTWVPGVIWFTLKCLFMFFLFAMVKAIVPRYRYDQLMRLGWKVFLPLSLAMVAIVAGVLQYGGLVAK